MDIDSNSLFAHSKHSFNPRCHEFIQMWTSVDLSFKMQSNCYYWLNNIEWCIIHKMINRKGKWKPSENDRDTIFFHIMLITIISDWSSNSLYWIVNNDELSPKKNQFLCQLWKKFIFVITFNYTTLAVICKTNFSKKIVVVKNRLFS